MPPNTSAGTNVTVTLALPRREGVGVFDLDARMPKTYDLFIDECHFTEAGNRRVAEELIEPIVAALGVRSE